MGRGSVSGYRHLWLWERVEFRPGAACGLAINTLPLSVWSSIRSHNKTDLAICAQDQMWWATSDWPGTVVNHDTFLTPAVYSLSHF